MSHHALVLSFQDLKNIGIDVRGHRKKLLHAIEYIPHLEIAHEVPVS